MQSVLRLRALVNSSVAADDDMQPLKKRTILRNKPCHGNHWKEVLYCHFQYGKNHSAVLNMSSDFADKLLRPSNVLIARNFPCGIFSAPNSWWKYK